MKLHHDREWLRCMYWDEGVSTRQMGKLAGVDGKTIQAQMVKHGIPRRNDKLDGFDTYKDREWLYQKYVVEELSTVEIAKLVGRVHETICNWMDKFEITRRDPLTAYSIFLSDEELEEAEELYKEGLGLKSLAEKYNLSYRQIRRNLEKVEVEYRPQNRQYSINEHVFDNLSDERAAYFAGFLFADACIYGTALQISLSQKDAEQVERIKTFLESDSPIRIIKNGGYRGESQPRLYCSGVHLSARLKELGVSNNIEGIKILRKELTTDSFRHWLRGFHDGDGSATKAGSLIFCGKREVLEFIRKRTDSVLNESGTRTIHEHRCGKVCYLHYGKGYPARFVSELMYAGATVYLNRKWKTVTEVWPVTSPGSVPGCAKQKRAA